MSNPGWPKPVGDDANCTTYRVPSGPMSKSVIVLKLPATSCGEPPGTTRQIPAAPATNGKPVSVLTYNAPSGPRTTSVGTGSAPPAVFGKIETSDTWPFAVTCRRELPP